jgi:hypothetical protein
VSEIEGGGRYDLADEKRIGNKLQRAQIDIAAPARNQFGEAPVDARIFGVSAVADDCAVDGYPPPAVVQHQSAVILLGGDLPANTKSR